MKPDSYSIYAVLVLAILLAGCQTSGKTNVVYEGNPLPQTEAEPEPAVVMDPAFDRARFLADILYEARVAFEDNRLMAPPGNNAFEIYQAVLDMDPGNAVAAQGMQDIVLRYVELADAAMALGQFDQADSYLARGRSLNPATPELEGGRQRLAAARQTKIQVYQLDPVALGKQGLEIMNELAEIAQHIQAAEATFLIKARTDEEGRWIYKIMREAVGGYRLRGNIDASGGPNILVTLPKS